jgi:flagellar biosynthesis protein FliR
MTPPFSVTSAQLSAWIVAFLWPFVRILALIGTAPVFSEGVVQRQLKVGLAALLAIAVSPVLDPMPAIPLISAAGLWILMQQVIIGAAMGFAMRMVFAAVQSAGEIVGLQMGLSFASFFDPTMGGNTMVVARILNALAMLLFLAMDVHLMVIGVLVESFHALPVADAPLSALGWRAMVRAGAAVFTASLMLALPLVTALLAINLAMGLLNRASPQLSIFAVGFPLTLLAGVVMLQFLMPHIGPFMEHQFAVGLSTMQEVLRSLRP